MFPMPLLPMPTFYAVWEWVDCFFDLLCLIPLCVFLSVIDYVLFASGGVFSWVWIICGCFSPLMDFGRCALALRAEIRQLC
jgi:hypothetical protein